MSTISGIGSRYTTTHYCSNGGAIFIPLFIFALNHLSLGRTITHIIVVGLFFYAGLLNDAARSSRSSSTDCYRGHKLIIFLFIIKFTWNQNNIYLSTIEVAIILLLLLI